jgi:pimeloyl-ACP methyl ester carboxylesterase
METAGFCMIDWVMGNQTSGYQWSKGYLEAEADFLREIIVSLFTNFILVGSSDGASIALLYAAKYQDCRAVISIAGHAKVEEGPKQELETLLKIQRKSFFN